MEIFVSRPQVRLCVFLSNGLLKILDVELEAFVVDNVSLNSAFFLATTSATNPPGLDHQSQCVPKHGDYASNYYCKYSNH